MPFGNKTLCIWHVPRTGGTWTYNTLIRCKLEDECRRLGQFHDTKQHYWEYRNHDYQAVIIRRPIDWYSSIWRWFKQYGVRAPIKKWFPDAVREDHFERFVLKHAGRYSELMDAFIPDNTIKLRLEYIKDDLTTLFTLTGVVMETTEPLTYPADNVSSLEKPFIPSNLASMVDASERHGCFSQYSR